MERLLLSTTAIGLAASWIYIFLLRARISDCVSHIKNRIEKDNSLFGSGDSRGSEEREAEGTGNPPRSQLSGAASSPLERARTAGKPQPLVEISGNHSSFHYRCSDCSRIFLLPEDQPAKEAARELFQCFEEHVAEEHSALRSLGDRGEPRQLVV
jgi:hypothetical protein